MALKAVEYFLSIRGAQLNEPNVIIKTYANKKLTTIQLTYLPPAQGHRYGQFLCANKCKFASKLVGREWCSLKKNNISTKKSPWGPDFLLLYRYIQRNRRMGSETRYQ